MPRRFLLDNDGTNFFAQTMRENIEGSIEEAVRECPDNVTTYLLCTGGATFLYPTRVGKVWTAAKLVVQAHAAGKDPFGIFLKALRQAGKETFVTFRMNDVHNANEPDHPLAPPFRLEHPEFCVDPEAVRRGTGDWMSYCLDYSHAEVREYFLALLREIVEWYEIDGLQLDWMRFPRHLSGTPDEVWSKRGAITEFTAAVRELIRKSGKRVALAARVPTSPAGCRYLGVDVAEWTRRGLLDFLVCSPFLTTDFWMPIQEVREALGAHRVLIYGGIEFGHGGQSHCPESLRAAAAGLLDCGADGIYLFNFPCWTEYLAARPYHWITELHEPTNAARKPMLFSVPHSMHRIPKIDLPHQLPAELPKGGSLELSMHLPQAALPAWRAIFSVHSGGDVALSLDGSPAPELAGLRRGQIFVEFIDAALAGLQRPKDEECRVFQPSPTTLTVGVNRLALENRADRPLQIDRVNLGLW